MFYNLRLRGHYIEVAFQLQKYDRELTNEIISTTKIRKTLNGKITNHLGFYLSYDPCVLKTKVKKQIFSEMFDAEINASRSKYEI